MLTYHVYIFLAAALDVRVHDLINDAQSTDDKTSLQNLEARTGIYANIFLCDNRLKITKKKKNQLNKK